MHILVVDSQGILNQEQTAYARDRLHNSLLRFEHRINGATMHFSLDSRCERVNCAINVSVERVGIVSIMRSNLSSDEVVNLAVDAIEPRVACRVDWRAWFNADTMATWFVSASRPLNWLFGFDRASDAANRMIPVKPHQIMEQRKRQKVRGAQLSMGSSNAKTFPN